MEETFVFIFWTIVIFAGIVGYFSKKQKEKEEQEKRQKKVKQEETRKNAAIAADIRKVDKFEKQLQEVSKVELADVSDYKKFIIENQKSIVDKGGDNQLFAFMKIDSFLMDFRNAILRDQTGIQTVITPEELKSRIKYENNKDTATKLYEDIEDYANRMDGKAPQNFRGRIAKFFEIGDNMVAVLNAQNKTMEYYRNMALALLVFYLNDNKIRYFEIYEAFEKLGVFDSTWQKSVLNKLDNIEVRLSQMSNQLTDLNQNFLTLIDSTQDVVAELKDINSGIATNNVLQAITAYQTWRMNKNIKSLGS